MLDAKLSRRLEAIAKVSQDGRKVQDLFKIMRSHDSLWLQAYANIYANKGAVTPGVNQNTLDGFSDERVTNIIQLLEEGRYHFHPSQRVYIPKANGKLRPLGLPTGDDKLVQEVARILLARLIHKSYSQRWSTPKSKLHDCHQVQDERFTSFALPCATQLRALRAGPMSPRRTSGLLWDHDRRLVTIDQSRRCID